MAGVDLSFGGTAFPRAFEVRQKLYEAGSRGVSTRFRRLDRLDSFYKCLEYAHQDTDWTGRPADRYETISPEAALPLGFTQPAAEKGVLEKRPSAPLRLCPMVVDRFTGLLFSKGRTPKVQVEDDPDSGDFLQAVFKRARFWRTIYQARTHGGSMGSSLVTVQLRRGRFSYKAHSPKLVHDVVWEDADLKIPAGVLIQYLFFQEQEVLDEKSGRPTGKMRQVPYLYRRIIDEQHDTTFIPAEVRGQEMPELQVDPHQTYEHGLGRFPGVWIQNLPNDEDMDGVPDCDGAFQMFDTIDRQIAQQNKGLLANMDPTLVISREKKMDAMGVPLRKGSENALNVGMGGSASYLEMAGGGIQASQEFIRGLKTASMDKTQAVLVDPERISGAAQSAKAIEFIYAPMLEKASRLREQYGEAIVSLGEVTLDLARAWQEPTRYEGNAVPRYDLPPRIEEHDPDPDNPDVEPHKVFVTRHPGEGTTLSLAWGPFFAPTPQDVQTSVTNVAAAYGGGLMDLETAVEKIAPLFDIEDTRALLRRIREEQQEKRAQMAEMRGMFPEPEPLGFEPEESEGLAV